MSIPWTVIFRACFLFRSPPFSASHLHHLPGGPKMADGAAAVSIVNLRLAAVPCAVSRSPCASGRRDRELYESKNLSIRCDQCPPRRWFQRQIAAPRTWPNKEPTQPVDSAPQALLVREQSNMILNIIHSLVRSAKRGVSQKLLFAVELEFFWGGKIKIKKVIKLESLTHVLRDRLKYVGGMMDSRW